MALPYVGPALKIQVGGSVLTGYLVMFNGRVIAGFPGRGAAKIFARDLSRALRRGCSGSFVSSGEFLGAASEWLNTAAGGPPAMSPPAPVTP